MAFLHTSATLLIHYYILNSGLLFADADYSECGTCGNINRTGFSILESKVMDEFGNPTQQRKLTPSDWYQLFKEHSSGYGKVNERQPVQEGQNQKPVGFNS